MGKKSLIIARLIFLLTAISFFGVLGVRGFSIARDRALSSISVGTANLESLPYLSWTSVKEEDRAKKGVVTYRRGSCFEGINLYSSQTKSEAHLIDMQGRTVHTWSLDTKQWHVVAMGNDGSLFFIIQDEILGKIDWDSHIQWESKMGYHHWIDFAENGDIYSLARDKILVEHRARSIPILNDFIVILSPGGEVKRKISIYKLVGDKIPPGTMDRVRDIVNREKERAVVAKEGPFDVFHTNAVTIIDRNIRGLCRKGDLLISIRELNLIAIVDIKKEKVIWSWGENVLDGQHAPSLLENGNILIFDNGKNSRDYSRIIELDPKRKKIVYEYRADPPSSFYSEKRGSCQKFPNGNLLITNSDSGCAFEVDAKGEIVWSFYNPDMEGEDKRATIYRLIRRGPDRVKNLKKSLSS